jgi:NAD(P)-dependent dehydrogenase (short-subunit alcohol dehydrogenase family)
LPLEEPEKLTMSNIAPSHQRTAIVTGGAKGIGRAVSEQLAASSWNLVLCGRDSAALEQAAQQIRSRHGVDACWVALDLSQPNAANELFLRWPSSGDLPLAMVCCAADYGVLGALSTIDFAAWKRSFDLNFFSIVEMIQRYVQLALTGSEVCHRRIVVMGGAGLGSAQIAGGISAYSCAKAALNRLVEVVDAEVRAQGISVNCVLPGLVNTGMVEQAIAAGPELGALYQASLNTKVTGGTPPEVAAEMIARLLDDDCLNVSGRLLSAKWDRKSLSSTDAVADDSDLFRLRRIDNDLFGRLK